MGVNLSLPHWEKNTEDVQEQSAEENICGWEGGGNKMERTA
jgi:hypothetical protein